MLLPSKYIQITSQIKRRHTFILQKCFVFPVNFLFNLSLSLSQGKCALSSLNLHKNILKGGKDLIKAIFLQLVTDTHASAGKTNKQTRPPPPRQKQPNESPFFSRRDILSNLDDKLVKVLHCVFGLTQQPTTPPFPLKVILWNRWKRVTSFHKQGGIQASNWLFLKRAVPSKIL